MEVFDFYDKYLTKTNLLIAFIVLVAIFALIGLLGAVIRGTKRNLVREGIFLVAVLIMTFLFNPVYEFGLKLTADGLGVRSASLNGIMSELLKDVEIPYIDITKFDFDGLFNSMIKPLLWFVLAIAIRIVTFIIALIPNFFIMIADRNKEKKPKLWGVFATVMVIAGLAYALFMVVNPVYKKVDGVVRLTGNFVKTVDFDSMSADDIKTLLKDSENVEEVIELIAEIDPDGEVLASSLNSMASDLTNGEITNIFAKGKIKDMKEQKDEISETIAIISRYIDLTEASSEELEKVDRKAAVADVEKIKKIGIIDPELCDMILDMLED